MKLKDYLRAKRGNHKRLYLATCIDPGHLSRIAAGAQRPLLQHAVLIEFATEGAVRVEDMIANPMELAAVAYLRRAA